MHRKADPVLALQQLHALRAAASGLGDSPQAGPAFSRLAEQQHTLLASLPQRYTDVLMGLLTRLESSALFTEESCSFSHRDLRDSLQLWLDKAEAVLTANPPT